MEAGTAVTQAVSAYKGIKFVLKYYWGEIVITSPLNREPVSKPWVPIRGKHKYNPKGIYWLVTFHDNKYWPQHRITFKPDLAWDGNVNVGSGAGPRTSSLIVVWTSEYTNQIFDNWKERGAATSNWDGLKLSPPSKEFQIITGIVMTVN